MKILLFLILVFPLVLYSLDWDSFEVSLDQYVWASSYQSDVFMNRRVDYSPELLFDNRKDTSWIEGRDDSGFGESVSFIVDAIPLKLAIINGCAASKNIFQKNNRVKRLRITPAVGISPPGYVNEAGKYLYFSFISETGTEFVLNDKSSIQTLDLNISEMDIENIKLNAIESFSRDYPEEFSIMLENSELGFNLTETDMEELVTIYGILYLKLEILDVYKGSKYDYTGISEISVIY